MTPGLVQNFQHHILYVAVNEADERGLHWIATYHWVQMWH